MDCPTQTQQRNGSESSVCVQHASDESTGHLGPQTFLLLVLPTLMVFLYVWLKEARGPYWLALSFDPDYQYLLNSLRLTQWLLPAHTDHPGTPLQVLGALVIGIGHWSSTTEDLVRHVLKNPEWYLDCISYTITFLYWVVLVVSGRVVYRATGGIFPALLIQLTPCVSLTSLAHLSRMNPEPVLLMLSSMYGAAIIVAAARPTDGSEKSLASFLGILTGLTLATKISALPLTLVPLIILGNHADRYRYVALAIISFFLLTLSLWLGGYGPRFASWAFRLATHAGVYGNGPLGVPDPSTYMESLREVLSGDPLVALTLLVPVAIVVCRMSHLSGHESGRFPATIERAFVALVICQVCQYVLAAKYPLEQAQRYLMPSLGLAGANLALAMVMIEKQWGRRRFVGAVVGIALLIAVPAIQAKPVMDLKKSLDKVRRNSAQVTHELASTYQGWTVIHFYRCFFCGVCIGIRKPVFFLLFFQGPEGDIS